LAGPDGLRAVQQRLAAQPPGDADGFADRGRRGLVIARAAEVRGVVEQAVGQVVRRGVLAEAGDRGGERRASVRVVAVGGEAGADQVAFGSLHGREASRRAGVEQREQLGGGVTVGQVVRGAGGQRPRPPQEFEADRQNVVQRGPRVAQGGRGLVVGGGGERVGDRDLRLVLRSSVTRRSPSPASAAWAAVVSPRSADSQAR
jgi:hypothetical protein